VAAVLSLHANLPGRGTLIVISFVVVLVTLIVPGVTLPWLVRVLKVNTADPHAAARQVAIRVVGAMNRRVDGVYGEVDPDRGGRPRRGRRTAVARHLPPDPSGSDTQSRYGDPCAGAGAIAPHPGRQPRTACGGSGRSAAHARRDRCGPSRGRPHPASDRPAY